MNPTDNQLLCIRETFGMASAIVAGAGSGKTATLTERVVYALQHPELSGVHDIDEILAITYTKKAAGELKSRIKAALDKAATPENGLALQALKVDGAWISTIHGMCSRILRENAFTFGVDPLFTVAEEDVCAEVLSLAVEEAFARLSDPDLRRAVDELVAEYRRDQVVNMVRELVSVAAESQGSPEELFVLPPRMGREAALHALVAATGEILARFDEQLQATGKLSPTAQNYVDGTMAALRKLHGIGDGAAGVPAEISPRRMAQLLQLSGAELLAIVNAFPKLTGSLKPAKEPLDCLPYMPGAALAQCALALVVDESTRHLQTLLQLATLVKTCFDARKRDLGLLDNSDLLALVGEKLNDPANQAVARRYAEQFKLVMVDEFQDTNQLQVDMINLVAGADSTQGAGAPSSKLCVVGDAQQSIYRFRNADLSVFQRHVRAVREGADSKVIELGDNFRSHNDILAFCRGVFSQAFGEDYLDLQHGRDENIAAAEAPFYGAQGSGEAESPEVPRRVNVKAFKTKGLAGYTHEAARAIAEDFKQLVDRGNRPGQMAVLLGKMTNAGAYAQALQDAGLKCAITGGSVFKSTPEARLMRDLCFALVDMRDTDALVDVLTSDLFCLSAADLLELFDSGYLQSVASGKLRSEPPQPSLRLPGTPDCAVAVPLQSGVGGRRREGCEASDRSLPPTTDCNESFNSLPLTRALQILGRAAAQVGYRPLAQIMEEVLADSGWLDRLGDDGQARAGNAFKAIRMLRDIERTAGITGMGLARAFDSRLSSVKEAPGVLSAEGDDFVRIMTVHASKGLSIPIVAVAETDFSTARGRKLRSYSAGGKTYLALSLGASLDRFGQRDLVVLAEKDYITKAGDFETEAQALEALQVRPSAIDFGAAADYYRAVKRLDYFGDIEEHQRKLYVAFTRAKDALIVAQRDAANPAYRAGGVPDVPSIIAALLQEEGQGFPDGLQVRYDHFDLAAEKDAEEPQADGADAAEPDCDTQQPRAQDCEVPDSDAQQPRAPFVVPAQVASRDLQDVPYRAQWAQGILSASSLSAEVLESDQEHAPAADVAAAAAAEADAEMSAAAPIAFEDDDPPAAATERGTAFHSLGEWSALHRGADASLPLPPPERIAATARLFGLNEQQRSELPHLVQRWVASDVAQAMAAHAYLVPEQPFWVQLAPAAPGRNAIILQGFIDLLAYDEANRGVAHVVDYKTGTVHDTDADRRKTYGIQAACYAYALLLQGFEEVRLSFVFVDQPDEADPAQPSVTCFPAPGDSPYTLDALREFLLKQIG